MTDEQMTHVIREVLNDVGYNCLRSAQITVEKGVVKLHGKVHSYYMKQVAQEALRNISGVTQVVNCVEVSDTKII